MKIPFATFKPMHDEIRKDLDQAYNKVIDSILSKEKNANYLKKSLRIIVMLNIV